MKTPNVTVRISDSGSGLGGNMSPAYNPNEISLIRQQIADLQARLDQLENGGGGGELAYPIGMELIDPSSSVDPALEDPFPAIQSGNVPLVVREYGGPELGFVHHLRLFAPEQAGIQIAALMQSLPNTLLPNSAANGRILRMHAGVWEVSDQYMEVAMYFPAPGEQIYVPSRDVEFDTNNLPEATFGAGVVEYALWDADLNDWNSLGSTAPSAVPAGLAMKVTVTSGPLALNLPGWYREIASET
ncbi:hypothetical protein [Deinococcus misasensis]|uniref:hypothetical protein n=1 Tax=Deinococcus misasensis TaxID=392413 RepID=UPI0005587C31|nr:hypothetical protein [Deinococcus misasensis]